MLTLLAHMGETTEAGEMTEMMGQMGHMWWTGMMGWPTAGFWWIGNILSWVTWILIIAVLVALLRWLWKKGGEGEKK